MRSQATAGMSRADARDFQKSIRTGLKATAEAKHRAALAAIDDEARAQREACGQATRDLAAKLDGEVAAAAGEVARAKSEADACSAERARTSAWVVCGHGTGTRSGK